MPTESRPHRRLPALYRSTGLVVAGAVALLMIAQASAETPVPATPPAPAPVAPPVAPATPKATTDSNHLGVKVDFSDSPFDGLSPELVNKLSAEEITKIMTTKAMHSDHLNDFGVPLVFFVFLGGVICASIYSSFRKDRQRHETLRLMVEKGAQIPPELVQPRPKQPNDLRRGTLLLATGIGLALFLRFTPGNEHDWSVGLLPMLIGAGYLLAWKMEPKPKALNLS